MGATEVTCSGAIPAGVSKEKALSVMHDHAGYFKALPSYREHKVLPGEGSADKVPDEIKARSVGGASGLKTTMYSVRNEVANPVFDSKVDTTYLMVDLVDGLWYLATSPMSVINKGTWEVKEGAGGLELNVSILIECSMVLKPMVKSQVQSNTNQLHKILIDAMQA